MPTNWTFLTARDVLPVLLDGADIDTTDVNARYVNKLCGWSPGVLHYHGDLVNVDCVLTLADITE